MTHNDAKTTQTILVQLIAKPRLAGVCRGRANSRLTQYDAKPCNRLHSNEHVDLEVSGETVTQLERRGESGSRAGQRTVASDVTSPSGSSGSCRRRVARDTVRTSRANRRGSEHRSPRRARPVGAKGSQLTHATNAPAAPDGLAPSELKVRS